MVPVSRFKVAPVPVMVGVPMNLTRMVAVPNVVIVDGVEGFVIKIEEIVGGTAIRISLFFANAPFVVDPFGTVVDVGFPIESAIDAEVRLRLVTSRSELTWDVPTI